MCTEWWWKTWYLKNMFKENMTHYSANKTEHILKWWANWCFKELITSSCHYSTRHLLGPWECIILLQNIRLQSPIKERESITNTGIKYNCKCTRIFPSKKVHRNFLTEFLKNINWVRHDMKMIPLKVTCCEATVECPLSICLLPHQCCQWPVKYKIIDENQWNHLLMDIQEAKSSQLLKNCLFVFFFK